MSNTIVIPISLPRELAKNLDRAARTRAMNRSEFIRMMIRRELSFQSLRELQSAVTARSRKAGGRTLEGAVRLVKELRRGSGK